MASSARHLFLVAFVATLAAVATPRAGAWGGGRFFFSKTTRPGAVVDEPEKVTTTGGTDVVVVPAAADAADPNMYRASTEFSRPSTGGSGGRGYGLYGRPEEDFPPDYFRRGVHRNAEKLTTTTTKVPSATTAVPVGGRGEVATTEPSAEDNGSDRGRAPWTYAYVPTTSTEETVVEDNGSGRGRAPWKYAKVPTTSAEETVPASGEREHERGEPFVEDNGSGWGRPRRYYGADGRPEEQQQQQQREYYGMSDTRLYQNGRYYYDVEAGRYGYGRESNPVRTRPEEFAGGYRRGRYYYGNRFDNGVMNDGGVQEEGRENGRYIP